MRALTASSAPSGESRSGTALTALEDGGAGVPDRAPPQSGAPRDCLQGLRSPDPVEGLRRCNPDRIPGGRGDPESPRQNRPEGGHRLARPELAERVDRILDRPVPAA